MTMKKKVKKLWVEALRSGNYKQGKYGLKREDEFCCLGVLCDLHAKENSRNWEPIPYDKFEMYGGQTAILPVVVRKWAGLDQSVPVLKSPKDDSTLDAVVLNDGGATFAQIADLIEAQL